MRDPSDDDVLRGATAYQQLHWLADGRVDATRLLGACEAAIERDNPRLNAFVAQSSDAAGFASASDARRQAHRTIGRLDWLVAAVKDNFDVAGMATRAGLPSRGTLVAAADASAVARLRASGAVIVGKTNLDEGAFGTVSASPHTGAVQNPWREGFTAGGSSGGSAAAVAAGLCSFALGSDTLGSVRIPASHCAVFGMKPTHGEISTRGMLRAARRLDSVGILARSVEDLAIAVQVLGGFDAADPRSRARRVPLATPDWEPGRLRCGVLGDLAQFSVHADVAAVFERALAALAGPLGTRVHCDFSDYDFARTRRAALLVMEAELGVELATDLADTSHPPSPRLRDLLGFAARKSAIDYAAADRLLDAAQLKARRLFGDIDVLACPTIAHGAYPLAEGERSNDADLTSFANVAGGPALSIPMGLLPDGLPIGLQLIGAPGADLRLLELATVCAAALDATPAYPVVPGS